MTDTQTSSFEAAFEEVQALAATFQAGEGHYLSKDYQEQEARQDFLDKFWTALGWDVGHDTQTSPYAQEVKVERGVTMAEGRKRADYAFYLDPDYKNPKFFVEAKKPSVDIANKDSYFQAIRYGWNAGTPLAVLTDFEQFHVLDSRGKPDIDTALSHAVQKYHYSDYADRDKFGAIYWLFSREAVAAGFLDTYAKLLPKASGKTLQRGLFHGGYQGIDESFLRELDEYRGRLARAFHASNPALDSETLTEATQRVLDRLVFVRFLEDKGIEPEPMVAHFGDKGSAWAGFLAVSRRLDTVYNGNIFKPHLIDKPTFHAPDTVFGQICSDLSSEQSPYLFSLIPIHILGSIYERFLGKVIVVDGGTALVEEKPEVRKAGGVYYTPDYIVRYIVDHTVGQQIDGKTPAEIADLRFADIACGSGSFLLGVYDCLLRYHTAYYNAKAKGRKAEAQKAGCEERDGVWHLSLWQKRQILLANVWGVDIDAQAVEVAQMSLYLKLLEDETTATAREQNLLHGAILPTLNKNIVFGNSLIGTDILEGQLFEPTEERKLNPLDFKSAFPQIMKNGGFDAIVGNPPYGQLLNGISQQYVNERFDAFKSVKDVYIAFIEKGMRSLREKGKLSFIVPSAWLGGVSYLALRDFLLGYQIETIISLPFNVFHDAYIDTLVFVSSKLPAESSQTVRCYSYPKKAKLESVEISEDEWHKIPAAVWQKMNDKKFVLSVGTLELIQRLSTTCSSTIADILDMKRGVLFDKALLTNSKSSAEAYLYFEGDVYRYEINYTLKNWIEYGPKMTEYPKDFRWFEGRRILLRRLVNRKQRLMASFADETFITNKNLYSLILRTDKQLPEKSDMYALGILNSKLLSRLYIDQVSQATKDDFPQVTIKDILKLPMPQADKAKHDQVVSRVEQMLAAKKERANALTDREIDYWQRRCDTLDRQIDELVYELYGLTDAEIVLVEGADAAGSGKV